jgi:ribosome silencing factor RsfS/YbeB/iojap
MTPKKTDTKTAKKSGPRKPRPGASKAPTRQAAARAAPKKPKPPERRSKLTEIVTAALDDLKAQNVAVLDVRELTHVADTVVIASGTSDRHVKSLAGRVLERAKDGGFRALGIEGEREGEWVLVDLQDVIVHVMLPRVREFYGLEKLWDVRVGERAVPA